eukprot:TRINITY_DN322_c0_g1_i1.p1 TRINITY_DN322_c0_g1~~TRINITY_DN322_c0_g1_i1.p1  ORF type:complete len:238 (-),score=35.86 TRINITY_DN322_c0_g1_i1:37-750(-)
MTVHSAVWLAGVESLYSELRSRENRWSEAEAHLLAALRHYHSEGTTVHDTLNLIERRIGQMPSILTTTRTRATAALLHEVRVNLEAAAAAAHTRPVWWVTGDERIARRALPRVLKRIRACVAVADHTGSAKKHLSFRAGETFAVLGRHSAQLYRARHKGRLGLVPVDKVRIVVEVADEPHESDDSTTGPDYDVHGDTSSHSADSSASTSNTSTTDFSWLDPMEGEECSSNSSTASRH